MTARTEEETLSAFRYSCGVTWRVRECVLITSEYIAIVDSDEDEMWAMVSVARRNLFVHTWRFLWASYLIKYTSATKARIVGNCGGPMGTPDLRKQLGLCTSLVSTNYSKATYKLEHRRISVDLSCRIHVDVACGTRTATSVACGCLGGSV